MASGERLGKHLEGGEKGVVRAGIVILSAAKDLDLRILRSFAVSAARDDDLRVHDHFLMIPSL